MKNAAPAIRALQSLAALALISLAPACASSASHSTPLQLDVYTAATPSGFGVTSTLIYGPREAILVDAQFLNSDAAALADRIEAHGRELTAIVITHPDADHIIGLALLHERFPEARLLMSAEGLRGFERAANDAIAQYKASRRPDEAPDAEPLPEAFSSEFLTVDGQRIELINDLQGDYPDRPSNTVLWIPSLRALIASDMAFDDVHVWLDKSTVEGRGAWRAGLTRLEGMNPSIVVAGHRGDLSAPHDPGVLAETRTYIEEFGRQRAANASADELSAAMRERYPAFAYPLFLQIAAASAYSAS